MEPLCSLFCLLFLIVLFNLFRSPAVIEEPQHEMPKVITLPKMEHVYKTSLFSLKDFSFHKKYIRLLIFLINSLQCSCQFNLSSTVKPRYLKVCTISTVSLFITSGVGVLFCLLKSIIIFLVLET